MRTAKATQQLTDSFRFLPITIGLGVRPVCKAPLMSCISPRGRLNCCCWKLSLLFYMPNTTPLVEVPKKPFQKSHSRGASFDSLMKLAKSAFLKCYHGLEWVSRALRSGNLLQHYKKKHCSSCNNMIITTVGVFHDIKQSWRFLSSAC